MSYLIAVATSNAKDVDLGFGAAKGFYIYEVDGTGYKEKEYREFTEEPGSAAVGACGSGGGCSGAASGCGAANSPANGAAQPAGPGFNQQPSGCNGPANGCGGSDGAQRKVELIADCRSLVCKKIGFQAQKQLEKRAIAGFDVDCTIDEAITKIAVYFNKIDNHISLRR